MPTNLLPLKLRIKFYLYRYSLYAFIFLMIFAFAFILHKHIEAFFLFACYIALRYRFPKTFHHPNAYWCVFWSVLTFWLCILSLLPLRLSILSCLVVALILCYVLYKVQDYIDIKNKSKEKVKVFSLETCTKDELLDKCREKQLSPNSTQIAISYFIDKDKSIYDIANEYGIEYDSARIRIKRIKKKLLE